MANWSDLPDDILILIVKRLRILSDYISFSCVCSSWRSVALQDRYNHPRLQRPGVVVLNDNGRQGFFPVMPIKLYREQDHHLLPPVILPREFTRECYSHQCNQGWLLIAARYPCMLMHLFNPATGARISLPSPSRAFEVSKILLSSNPSFTSMAIYAVILYNTGEMDFCQLGDQVWTPIIPNCPYTQGYYYDAIFFNDAIFFKGKLYVVEYKTGEFFVCDLNTSPISMIEAATLDTEHMVRTQNFLVELGEEELLHVVLDIRYNAKELRIFKLDFTRNCWIVVESLGEYALFLGYKQAFSLSDLDVRGIKRNCIYISTNTYYGILNLEDSKTTYHEIFNLEDSRTEPLFPTNVAGNVFRQFVFWFNPIPW